MLKRYTAFNCFLKSPKNEIKMLFYEVPLGVVERGLFRYERIFNPAGFPDNLGERHPYEVEKDASMKCANLKSVLYYISTMQ